MDPQPYNPSLHDHWEFSSSSNRVANSYFNRLSPAGPDSNHPTWVLARANGYVGAFVASKRRIFRRSNRAGRLFEFDSFRIKFVETNASDEPPARGLLRLLGAHIVSLAESPAYSKVEMVDVLAEPPMVPLYRALSFRRSRLRAGDCVHLYLPIGTLRQAIRLARRRVRGH